MTRIAEIGPDLYRISIYVPELDLQFNHFLVNDDEPLLYHTGMRRMFPLVHQGVARVIDPSQLRWIAHSHFEADECGALNEWLRIAPAAQAVSGVVGTLPNLSDFAQRPPRAMTPDEILSTGTCRFRFLPTPHLPHGWDAGLLFEETSRTLFCSDLLLQNGNPAPMADEAILERARSSLIAYQAGPLMNSMSCTPHTERLLRELAGLQPTTLAVMHGSSYIGDGTRMLHALGPLMREVLEMPPETTVPVAAITTAA